MAPRKLRKRKKDFFQKLEMYYTEIPINIFFSLNPQYKNMFVDLQKKKKYD